MSNSDDKVALGEILRQHRVTIPLTLYELSSMSGVSTSHLGRIERGERYPSASILRKIAKPLGFEENELFTLAGYLTPLAEDIAEERKGYQGGVLDSYVGKMLGQESREMQHAVLGILAILKGIARDMSKANPTNPGT